MVGRGRWGSSLLAGLRLCGIDACTTDLRKFKRPARKAAWTQATIFWLCVPDAAISATVRQLVSAMDEAGGVLQKRIVLHSSGVHSSELLAAAREAGAGIATVHPLMSFPTRRAVPLEGVPFAVEAEGRLRTKLFRLVQELGGQPFAIDPAGKALYHAAAVMASPLLVSLAAATDEIARAAGLSPEQAKAILQPIMTASLRNFFQNGAAKSFSGPFARGDAETVSLHLAALGRHPDWQAIYRSLAGFALRALPVENRRKLRRSLAWADAGRKFIRPTRPDERWRGVGE